MGMAKVYDGKPAEALDNLDRAVNANSQNYLVHYYYAFALSRQGSDPSHLTSGLTPETYSRIRAELLKAIELRPDFPASYSLLCFVALVTGDHLEEARTLSERNQDLTGEAIWSSCWDSSVENRRLQILSVNGRS
jgi:hypothetical protein